MSNPFRDQIEELINSKIGTNANRTIIGTITKVDQDKGTCTVCPLDLDTIWEMKKYYARTKIDRMAAQGTIESVSTNHSSGIKDANLQVGDRVSINYDEDTPYIVKKIKPGYAVNRKFVSPAGDMTTYDWLGSDFGDIREEIDLPVASMDAMT